LSQPSSPIYRIIRRCHVKIRQTPTENGEHRLDTDQSKVI
jgi:hypothetical protein